MNKHQAQKFNRDSNFAIKAILALAIMLAYNITWFKNDGVFLLLSFVIVFMSSLSLLSLYKIDLKALVSFFTLFNVILYIWLMNNIVGGNTANIGIYINICICIIISYIIIIKDRTNIIFKVFYKFYFYYIALILLILLLGRDPENIYLGSRNLISQLFVIFGGLFFIYEPFRSQMNHKIPFYICIVAVCVLAMGRSGIITSIILLLAVLIDHYKFQLVITRKHLLRASVLIMLIVALFIYKDLLTDFLETYSKFSYLRDRGASDTSRSLMIEEYIKNFNIQAFFFGVNLESLPIISSYNNNPHNSYIYLHSKLGILAILIFCFIALFLFKLIIKLKFSLLLATIAILIRLATDSLDALITLPVIFICMYGAYYNQVSKY